LRERIVYSHFLSFRHGTGERGERDSPTLNRGVDPLSLPGVFFSFFPAHLCRVSRALENADEKLGVGEEGKKIDFWAKVLKN